MPSPSPASALGWILRKEWRELMASRAWWVVFTLTGPIVGVCFIAAVRQYGELSAGGGEAFSPLSGVYGPTLGAYEIVALFLLPFVAIRLVGADRQSGALFLQLQQRLPPAVWIAAKSLVLLGGWAILQLAAAVAALLWTSYGGHTYLPEIAVVLAGHLLNAGIAISLGCATAAVAEHPSTAAILTLGVTVGAWMLSFLAAVEGGFWSGLAGFTPSAMLGFFQRGLLRADLVLAALILILAGMAVASLWLRLGTPRPRRWLESATVAALAGLLLLGASRVPGSWDLSENRQNSFPEADEAVLRSIRAPLAIEAHFAPADGRRAELERVALSKLRRIMPHLRVSYVARTSSGLFEQADPEYGEIVYTLGGRTVQSRAVTADGVLETIYGLAKVTPPPEDEPGYPGYPLPVRPAGAAIVFYAVWPLLIGGLGILVLRRFP